MTFGKKAENGILRQTALLRFLLQGANKKWLGSQNYQNFLEHFDYQN